MNKMNMPILALFLAAAVAVACGGEGSEPAADQKSPAVADQPAPKVEPAVPAAGTEGPDAPVPAGTPDLNPNAPLYNPNLPTNVTVKGTVTFKGERPKRSRIDMATDAKCAGMHSRPVLTEDEIVNKDNMGIKNVLVYVKKGWEKQKYETPKAAQIDQEGCQYKPRVLFLMPGQKLEIKNSDDTTHNVHGLPKKSRLFNFTQHKQGSVDVVTLDNPEMAVKVKCDIHNWMGAWISVLPHPLAAVTDENGAYTMPALPAGDYTIAFWHEVYGEKTVDVKVGKDMKPVDFTFSR